MGSSLSCSTVQPWEKRPVSMRSSRVASSERLQNCRRRSRRVTDLKSTIGFDWSLDWGNKAILYGPATRILACRYFAKQQLGTPWAYGHGITMSQSPHYSVIRIPSSSCVKRLCQVRKRCHEQTVVPQATAWERWYHTAIVLFISRCPDKG